MVISVLNILTISCNGGEKISPTLGNDGGNSKWDECEDSTLKLDGGFYCPLFVDDFEDGNYDGWNGGARYNKLISNTYAANRTNHSLYLKGGDARYCDGLYRELNNLKPKKVSFYIRSRYRHKHDGYFVIGNGCYKRAVYFYMRGDGKMVVHDGNDTHERSYNSSFWYKVVFDLDWTNKTVDYYVNNRLVSSDIPFRENSVESLTRIYLFNHNYSEAWWDEIFFYE